MKTQHTPTPWKLAVSSTGVNYIRANVENVPDRIVAISESILDGKNNSKLRKEAKANAELIVKAVNSHEALLEACKLSLEYMFDDKSSNITGEKAIAALQKAIEQAEK